MREEKTRFCHHGRRGCEPGVSLAGPGEKDAPVLTDKNWVKSMLLAVPAFLIEGES